MQIDSRWKGGGLPKSDPISVLSRSSVSHVRSVKEVSVMGFVYCCDLPFHIWVKQKVEEEHKEDGDVFDGRHRAAC